LILFGQIFAITAANVGHNGPLGLSGQEVADSWPLGVSGTTEMTGDAVVHLRGISTSTSFTRDSEIAQWLEQLGENGKILGSSTSQANQPL